MTNSFTPNIAPIAALIGDPARAAMLVALMGGKALTVSELGAVAGLTKGSASSHLAQLLDAGLLCAQRSGRHKYLSLAGPDVAGLIEALMTVVAGLSPDGVARARAVRTGPRDPAMRRARLCYDHLAGSYAVQIFDVMSRQGHFAQLPDGLVLTAEGQAFLTGLGVALPKASRSPACRACLDWSERKSHLGGAVGRAVLAGIESQGWVIRQAGSRALVVTPVGEAGFARIFPAVAHPQTLDLAAECP
jgi:DNA-binding transcriptional ArsR family regulator